MRAISNIGNTGANDPQTTNFNKGEFTNQQCIDPTLVLCIIMAPAAISRAFKFHQSPQFNLIKSSEIYPLSPLCIRASCCEVSLGNTLYKVKSKQALYIEYKYCIVYCQKYKVKSQQTLFCSSKSNISLSQTPVQFTSLLGAREGEEVSVWHKHTQKTLGGRSSP